MHKQVADKSGNKKAGLKKKVETCFWQRKTNDKEDDVRDVDKDKEKVKYMKANIIQLSADAIKGVFVNTGWWVKQRGMGRSSALPPSLDVYEVDGQWGQ